MRDVPETLGLIFSSVWSSCAFRAALIAALKTYVRSGNPSVCIHKPWPLQHGKASTRRAEYGIGDAVPSCAAFALPSSFKMCRSGSRRNSKCRLPNREILAHGQSTAELICFVICIHHSGWSMPNPYVKWDSSEEHQFFEPPRPSLALSALSFPPSLPRLKTKVPALVHQVHRPPIPAIHQLVPTSGRNGRGLPRVVLYEARTCITFCKPSSPEVVSKWDDVLLLPMDVAGCR